MSTKNVIPGIHHLVINHKVLVKQRDPLFKLKYKEGLDFQV